MKAAVTDLRAVTSRHWLRDMIFMESSVTVLTSVLVYLDAALVSNGDQFEKIVLLALLIASSRLVAIANEQNEVLRTQGDIIRRTDCARRATGGLT